ncbi:MAG: GrpB family protein [Halanaerobiales bacterium]|nr:GrpB family protein [Halanaerobiales bacterium]
MSRSLSEMSLEELWQLFPIILKAHNPEYKNWYREEKEKLVKTLPDDYLERINHIGSTAVPGLLAKPTVDILLEIKREADLSKIESKLKNDGWILMHKNRENQELDLVFNKGYTPEGFADKVSHLHLRYFGDWDELYFRDYLVAHPEIAAKYGELKKSLAANFKNNRDGYTKAKTEFINKCTAEARREFNHKYLSKKK